MTTIPSIEPNKPMTWQQADELAAFRLPEVHALALALSQKLSSGLNLTRSSVFNATEYMSWNLGEPYKRDEDDDEVQRGIVTDSNGSVLRTGTIIQSWETGRLWAEIEQMTFTAPADDSSGVERSRNTVAFELTDEEVEQLYQEVDVTEEVDQPSEPNNDFANLLSRFNTLTTQADVSAIIDSFAQRMRNGESFR